MQSKGDPYPTGLRPMLRSVPRNLDDAVEVLAFQKKGWCHKDELPLSKALQANNEDFEESQMSQNEIIISKDITVSSPSKPSSPSATMTATTNEEYLKDFLRWSSLQSIQSLPVVTCDQPLLPSKIGLPAGILLHDITDTIASVLQDFQNKGCAFCYKPHDDHPGLIEICSLRYNLKFVIQLWQADRCTLPERCTRMTPVKPGVVVVVELQRRRGCCVFMHHLRRPLFKALAALSQESNKSSAPLLAQPASSSHAPLEHVLAVPFIGNASVTNKRAPREQQTGTCQMKFPPPLHLPSF